jgi:acyl carrier protein
MQREEIETIVRTFVQEVSGADATHAQLLVECGIDSVCAVDLVALIEDRFCIEIPDAVIPRLKSVDEVVACIVLRLGQAGASPEAQPAEAAEPRDD